MFRKDLISLLQDKPLGLKDIATLLEMTPREVESDLRQFMKSFKYSEYCLHITLASCRKCAFKFQQDKLHKPGKCPRCHGTWIQDPLLEIKERS